jgi:hypothetical protein
MLLMKIALILLTIFLNTHDCIKICEGVAQFNVNPILLEINYNQQADNNSGINTEKNDDKSNICLKNLIINCKNNKLRIFLFFFISIVLAKKLLAIAVKKTGITAKYHVLPNLNTSKLLC